MNIQFKSNEQLNNEIQVTIEANAVNGEVTRLMHYLGNFDNKDYIVVNVAKAHHIVAIKDIQYIEVNVDMLSIKTKNETYQYRYRLYKILEDINSPKFIQVSKDCIINIDHLKKLETSFYGNIYAILQDDKRINVTRTYYKKIKQYLEI